MKFIDTVKFNIKAGDGGNGAVSFYHTLFVPNGGPNGGDGGNGGNVIFEADDGKYSLLDLKLRKQLVAEQGFKGDINNMHGAQGKDLVFHVPIGTLIIDNKTGKILADMNKKGKQVIIAKGGKGGKGNARFANSRNKAPTIFEAGELGQQFEVKAELKVLADVGFVGLPNVGKSTLLRAISNSKPEVADYTFTTLNPHLGVAKAKNKATFVVADLPGLIKGSSLGKGLGHHFLKHIERCRIICHILDMSGNYGQEDVIKNYELIRSELIKYNFKLDKRPEIVVFNKMDTDEAQINILDEQIINYFLNKKIVLVSGLKKKNIDQMLLIIAKQLKKTKYIPLWEIDENNHYNNEIKLYHFKELPKDIQIINKGNKHWEVSGKTIFKIFQKYPITTNDNLLLFNEKLKKIGLFNLLRARGVSAGDTVSVFNYDLDWIE